MPIRSTQPLRPWTRRATASLGLVCALLHGATALAVLDEGAQETVLALLDRRGCDDEALQEQHGERTCSSAEDFETAYTDLMTVLPDAADSFAQIPLVFLTFDVGARLIDDRERAQPEEAPRTVTPSSFRAAPCSRKGTGARLVSHPGSVPEATRPS